MTRSARLLAVVAVAVLSGCSAPTPEEVAERTATDIAELVRGAIATASGTNAWTSVDEFFVSTGLSRSAADRPKFPDASSADSTLDFVTKLTRRIFTQANVVSSAGGATVFALTGAVLCSDGNSAPSMDCVETVDKLGLKVKATGGLDLTLQVGPSSLEPLVLRVRGGKSLALELDLDVGQRTYEFVAQALGSRSSLGSTTIQSAGRVSFTLEKFAADDYQLSQAVSAPVAVTVTDQQGVSRRFNLESRSPAIALRLEGPARRGSLTVDWGKATWSGPYRDFNASSALPGGLDVSLAGLGAQLKFEDGKGSSVAGLTLGNAQSFLSYAGRNFITVDLNDGLGRKVDVGWSKSARGLSFVLTPGIDLKVYTGFAVLKTPTSGSTDPAFDDTSWQGTFSAQSGNPTIEVIAPTQGSSGGVKLVNGAMTLKSNQPTDVPRTFNAGVCLGGGSGGSSPRNPVLDALSAVNCP